MSKQKISFFSSKKKNGWIFGLVVVFFLLVAIQIGDYKYNAFSSWLAEKTSNTIVLPKIKENQFRLGLDLQGGSQLIYQADVSNISDADKDDLLDGVRDVIERRVNTFGVSEPVIQINKTIDNDYRIIVELAGIKNVDDAIKEIGETPKLEFKEQDTENISIDEQSLSLMNNYNQGLQTKMDEILQKINEGNDFAQLAIANNTPLKVSDDPNSPGTENNGDLGWINENDPENYNLVKDLSVGQISSVFENENFIKVLKLEDKRMGEESKLQEYKVREIALIKMTEDYLKSMSENWKNTELTGKNLKRAVLQFNPNDNRPEVSLEFDEEGSQLFEQITERNVGRPVAIYLDDYPISVPNVNEKISGGKAVISGNFTIDEAKELVQRLKAGALPVPIELINQKTVGATLGHQSIVDSLEAGIIGIILVALFMLIFYRFFGLSSVFSLIIYGLSVLAIFKALPLAFSLTFGLLFVALILMAFDELKILDFPLTILFVAIGVVLFVYGLNSVTLTLAGVAGFILSIGMAVDANVLIFERIKEEVRSGRSLRDAVDEGTRRAWPSIRDGNFSTLLMCLVLMSFGTGVLKGFGTTLFIGVSISMFSAIVITRSFLLVFLGKKMEKMGFLFGVKIKDKN
ncbi:MAG TPA: peptidylprolyl isomerase [bacterium]|nr:peptidylprolyl isomerase [bacterium]HPV65655.1 peptidylprolyl isomerase [bacterium]